MVLMAYPEVNLLWINELRQVNSKGMLELKMTKNLPNPCTSRETELWGQRRGVAEKRTGRRNPNLQSILFRIPGSLGKQKNHACRRFS